MAVTTYLHSAITSQPSPYSDRIEVLGHRSDIPDLLSGSDLFVYVSYLDSISTAVLKAQAAGLPVIGGDVVGVPTAVGDAGRLCEPTSIEVERAVLDILGNSTHREKLARQSEERMTEYNERAARQYVYAWDVLIEGRRLTGEHVPLDGLASTSRTDPDRTSQRI